MLDDQALDVLFRQAHTHHGWLDKPVADETLRELYELLRMAPTATNSQPVRLVFVKTKEAKDRLRPTLSAGNVDKTMAAPVTAIVAYDTRFYEHMPKLMPSWSEAATKLAALAEPTRDRMAFLSATLQAGYLILAARAMGLDCGPMGGFEADQLDKTFFPDGRWKSFLLVNLGHGDVGKVRPRNPRLSFDEAARIE